MKLVINSLEGVEDNNPEDISAKAEFSSIVNKGMDNEEPTSLFTLPPLDPDKSWRDAEVSNTIHQDYQLRLPLGLQQTYLPYQPVENAAIDTVGTLYAMT